MTLYIRNVSKHGLDLQFKDALDQAADLACQNLTERLVGIFLLLIKIIT